MSEEELFASVERLDPVEEASRVASTVTRDADKHTVLHDIAKAHQEMYALYEISQNIGTTLGLQETATLITTKMGHIVDCNTCVLYLLDSNYSELEARGAVGQFAAAFERLHLALGDGPTGWAVAQRQPVVNGEAYHDLHGSRAGDEAAELESALAFPLIPEDEGVIGCLTLYHTKREAFTEDDLRMLSMVGRRAAMAVKNALTFEETRASALTDGITGLANSRYYFMCVEHEFSRAAREGLPLSLVVVDLDNFKEVNDNFGHAIGDQVLRDMARLLREQVRDRDTVVRYGGDEFFVVLPETNRAAAEKIAHRIEDAAARYSLQPRTDKRISVGLSIGVATYPDDSTEANELLRIADDRMYQVKHIHRQPLRLVA
jgi:diguanylate cyclase (GGDEF)-like protein